MIEISISGMSCENCARHVREALGKLAGVRKVSVSLEKGLAEVDSAAELSDAQLREAIEEEGYEVKGIARK